MCVFCIPEAFPGLARKAVLQIPPRPPIPPRLPLYTIHPPLSYLQSTLAKLSASIDSKTLTENLNPLAATHTRKGGGGPSSALKVCQLATPCPSFRAKREIPLSSHLAARSPWPKSQGHSSPFCARAHKLGTPVSPQPQSPHTLPHGFRHTWGWGSRHPPSLQVLLQIVPFRAQGRRVPQRDVSRGGRRRGARCAWRCAARQERAGCRFRVCAARPERKERRGCR
jgi:hypothetical protein